MTGVAYAAAVPTYTINPTSHNFGSGNHTVSFSIPVTLCQTQCYCLNVGFCDDSNTRVSLGSTGVIQGLIDVGRTTDLNDGNPYWYDGTGVMAQAPPETNGVGAKGVLLWYCADGNCQPLTTPLDLAAGVGVPTVYERGSVCPVSGTCAPRGAQVTLGNTVAAVQVGTTTIPVGHPGATACVDPIEYAMHGMGQVGSGGPLSTDTCWYGPQTTFDPTGRVVGVGSGGGGVKCDGTNDWPRPTVAVSFGGGCAGGEALAFATDGGCATGGVAVGVEDEGRCSPFESSSGLAALGLLGGDSRSFAAVSDFGDADGNCVTLLAICLASGVAVSGTGSATSSGHAISGGGDATTTRPSWDVPGVPAVFVPHITASGLGDASGGTVAVAGGNASGATAAIAGGDASANGGVVAVSATGQAQGGVVNVDSDGVG